MQTAIRLCVPFALALLFVSPIVAESEPPADTRVLTLIQRLGSDNYSHRQQAERELKRMGDLALDHLLQAQYDENSEISLAALQLLSQLPVNWMQPDDPDIVTVIMRGYHNQAQAIRLSRAEWLAMLEDGYGAAAIARIVRYDQSELVAKQAAISLLQYIDSEDPSQVEAAVKAISQTMGSSPRIPAQWLRTLRTDLTKPSTTTLDVWENFVTAEQAALKQKRSSSAIISALTEHYADRVLLSDDVERKTKVIQELVEARKEDGLQLLETVHWLLDNQQGKLLEELILNRNELFEDDELVKQLEPHFLYGRAELLKQRGELEAAEKVAEQAFKLTEVDEDTFFDPDFAATVRFQTAVSLEGRGQTEWAIREYQRLIAVKTDQWRINWIRERAVWTLAELLHDHLRDREAADTLEVLTIDKDELKLFRNENENPFSNVLSRMYFFESEHHRQQADREKQVEYLKKAISADPTDADVLIAMHRLPRTNQAWKADTSAKIKKAAGSFETKLQRLRGDGIIKNRQDIATDLNQVAWLIGNTEGDLPLAVQRSRESLELRPQSAGTLDTLGRAYFAVGDLKNAIKYQRRAVKLQPHTQQISRQLTAFEAAAKANTSN